MLLCGYNFSTNAGIGQQLVPGNNLKSSQEARLIEMKKKKIQSN